MGREACRGPPGLLPEDRRGWHDLPRVSPHDRRPLLPSVLEIPLINQYSCQLRGLVLHTASDRVRGAAEHLVSTVGTVRHTGVVLPPGCMCQRQPSVLSGWVCRPRVQHRWVAWFLVGTGVHRATPRSKDVYGTCAGWEGGRVRAAPTARTGTCLESATQKRSDAPSEVLLCKFL